jgi:hypothetical protein
MRAMLDVSQNLRASFFPFIIPRIHRLSHLCMQGVVGLDSDESRIVGFEPWQKLKAEQAAEGESHLALPGVIGALRAREALRLIRICEKN